MQSNEEDLTKYINELFQLAVKGKIASLTVEDKHNGDYISLANTAVNEVCDLFDKIELFSEGVVH